MTGAFVCSNCGHLGDQKQVTKGSFAIEILLWLCFLIPGLIYSFWRLSSRHGACARCDALNPVPLDSPRGVQLAKQYHPNIPPDQLQAEEYRGNAAKGRTYLAIIAIILVYVLYLIFR